MWIERKTLTLQVSINLTWRGLGISALNDLIPHPTSIVRVLTPTVATTHVSPAFSRMISTAYWAWSSRTGGEGAWDNFALYDQAVGNLDTTIQFPLDLVLC